MSGLVLQLIVAAVIIWQGLIFLGKKRIKANLRREEMRSLVRLAESEAERAESERIRISAQRLAKDKEDGHRNIDAACFLCFSTQTTTTCARCKVARYCSGKCQIVHWRQGHRRECVETKVAGDDKAIRHVDEPPKVVNHHEKGSYEADEPWNDKQPSMPDAIINNSSDSMSITLEDVFGSASADAEEENTNPNPLIESSEDATKKALEQSEERVRHLEEELAKSKKDISLIKSECSNWSARTSFVSRRLCSLMRESDENQIAEQARISERSKEDQNLRMLESECARARRELLEEQERVRRLKLEVEKITGNSMRKVEEVRAAERRKHEKYMQMLENGRMKALRELEEERELVRLAKMECEEIRQSFMRQMEKKELDLANALNAAAAAEEKLSDLEREINSIDDKACAICLTSEKDVAFGCGHMTCGDCMLTISNCHICRKPITSRLRLFPG